MRKPKELVVPTGRVGRGASFQPHFELIYTDGTKRTGVFSQLAPALELVRTFKGRTSGDGYVAFDPVSGHFSRVFGAEDGIVSCFWRYAEPGSAAIDALSHLFVSGSLVSFEIEPLEVLLGNPVAPVDVQANFHFTDSTSFRKLTLRNLEARARPSLESAQPAVCTLRQDGRLEVDKGAHAGLVFLRWKYREGNLEQRRTSTLRLSSQHPGNGQLSALKVVPVGSEIVDPKTGFEVKIVFEVSTAEPRHCRLEQRLTLWASGFRLADGEGNEPERMTRPDLDRQLRQRPVGGTKQLMLGQEITDWTHLPNHAVDVVLAADGKRWISDGIDTWRLPLCRPMVPGVMLAFAFSLTAVTRLVHHPTAKTLATSTSHVLYAPVNVELDPVDLARPERFIETLQNDRTNYRAKPAPTAFFKAFLNHKTSSG